jgi:hypothetical protein
MPAPKAEQTQQAEGRQDENGVEPPSIRIQAQKRNAHAQPNGEKHRQQVKGGSGQNSNRLHVATG